MRGKVLTVPGGIEPGMISGEDGRRYRFADRDLRGAGVQTGQEVDFEALADDARAVYPVLEYRGPAPFFTPRMTEALKQRAWAAFYLSPQGRVGRRDYWLYGFLVLLMVNLVLGLIPVIGHALSLVTAWCGIALAIKRCHDVGRSGWWNLLPAAPLAPLVVGVLIAWASRDGMIGLAIALISGLAMVGLWIWFVAAVLVWPGDVGSNRFGPPPPPARF